MTALAPGLIYAGIDEAGYGPRLGPLCVASTSFDVQGWSEGDAPPDLWKTLAGAVGQTTRDAQRGLIAVNDSKALKLPNQTKTRHPLVHLETGVLGFLALLGLEPATDIELFEALGECACRPAWHGEDPSPIPVAVSREELGIRVNRLRATCREQGVTLIEMRCVALDAMEFNRRLENLDGKAEVSFGCVAELLRRVWEASGERRPRVVIDRQGGRRFYEGKLEAAIEDARVDSRAESQETSFYSISGNETGAGPARSMAIRFEVEADARHLPTALASMCAKYVRELHMARFNRHWSARLPELKPTAGYGLDARRWLEDMRDELSAAERNALVRRA